MTSRARTWMSVVLVAILFTIRGSIARAEIVSRNASETDDAFMSRLLGPSAELAQKVVRSTELVAGKTTLVGFETAENKPLVGHLLVQVTDQTYQHVPFASCDIEGDTPRLLAVFFARTAKDGGRDLGVLCSWDVRHADADGTLYGAAFYRVTVQGSRIAVAPLSDLNARFKTQDLSGTGDHGKRFHDKPKFTTVKDVKRLLTSMGFRQ